MATHAPFTICRLLKASRALVWAPHEATPEKEALFAASHDSMNQGWSGNIDMLEDYLSLLHTP